MELVLSPSVVVYLNETYATVRCGADYIPVLYTGCNSLGYHGSMDYVHDHPV